MVEGLQHAQAVVRSGAPFGRYAATSPRGGRDANANSMSAPAYRRDLSDLHARLASEAGVKIVLNTDAHGVDTLDNMAYAVATARRAWLTADDVANTRGWAKFKKLLKG